MPRLFDEHSWYWQAIHFFFVDIVLIPMLLKEGPQRKRQFFQMIWCKNAHASDTFDPFVA